MEINGIIGEMNLEISHAADGRHGPVLKTVELSENIGELKAGELLFRGADGAVSAKDASAVEASSTVQAQGGAETEFDIDLGQAVIPGTVKVETDDDVPKKLTDAGDGTLEGDSGAGTVDYVTGKIHVEFSGAPAEGKKATAEAIPAGGFIGVLDDDIIAGEAAANVVVHGTVYEGIAKLDGAAASKEQLAFLSGKGIY